MSKIIIDIKYLGGEINNIHNSGQNPQTAKWEYVFFDDLTGEVITTTDLQIKKDRRWRALSGFLEAYGIPFFERRVSVMLVVVDATQYTGSEFISFFKKKMKRKGLIFSYVQLRDVGEVEFKIHFHFVFVFRRLENTEIKDLIRCKISKGYNFVMCESLTGFISGYLKDKEIYAPFGCRSFSRSRRYLSVSELRSRAIDKTKKNAKI